MWGSPGVETLLASENYLADKSVLHANVEATHTKKTETPENTILDLTASTRKLNALGIKVHFAHLIFKTIHAEKGLRQGVDATIRPTTSTRLMARA
jgi:hypothetical protein